MTTTANHHRTAGGNSNNSGGSSSSSNNNNNHLHHHMAPEPEEDIAAIAKQISDHAEAIYQTWKARGLAPNEILTCHRDSTTAAADKFGSALTPQPKPAKPLTAAAVDPNNSLERLVNKFVVEDKARLAVRQCRSPSPKPFASSIQYALQKFEQKASEPAVKPNGGGNTTGNVIVKRYSKSPVKSYPDDFVSSAKNIEATTTTTTTTTTNAAPTSAWPFRKSSSESSQNAANDFMDEVAKEEQRLIDALKNGSVIENNNCRKTEKPAVPSKEGVVLRSTAGYDVIGGNRSKPEFLIGLSALSSSRRNLNAHRQHQELVPHPELTDHQRANIRSNHHQQSNPVRPFLTRGSVAERVLIFEKCPTELMKNTAAAAAAAAGTNNHHTATQSWRNIGSDVHGKIQVS